ncbi:hypothetical protein WJX81_007760 [Elliptochloris bilobata]|uniref:Membrane magnesium transporter n=1 Tax=Elliptochloris bilobata TaxID=381761 RepID=A0AAW1R1X4_9CHLO
MAPKPSALAILAGVALFLVAGYQVITYRDMLKLTQEVYEGVPLAVRLEVLVAAVLCMWGSLHLAGELRPISALANQEGLEADTFRPDFMAFNHRGHLMPLDVPPLAKA